MRRTGRMAVAMVAVGMVAGGCVSVAEVQALRDETAGLRQRFEAQAQQWAQVLAQLPAGDPRRIEAEAALQAARAGAAVSDAGVRRLDAVLARANDENDTLVAAVRAVAERLPGPAGGTLLVAAAAVAALLRAAQLKRALASVARGIEKAKQEDEQFRLAFARQANTFRAIQTPTAQRLVDQVTGRRSSGRWPM